MLESADLDALIKQAWEKGVTAKQLFELTPAQLVATFYVKRSATPTPTLDPLEAAIRANEKRDRAGLPAVVSPMVSKLLRERTR